MQQSSQRYSPDWRLVFSRHEKYNGSKHFNKVGCELFYMDKPRVTQPTGFGEPLILLLFCFCPDGAQNTIASIDYEYSRTTHYVTRCSR
eukprot:10070928-Heterocapsa_arctica.AAC.1